MIEWVIQAILADETTLLHVNGLDLFLASKILNDSYDDLMLSKQFKRIRNSMITYGRLSK